MKRNLLNLVSSSTRIRFLNRSPAIIKNNISQLNSNLTSTRNLASFTIKGVHEPEYLDYLKPQIPFYKLINIQIRGYDYAVLESYGSYLHRLSNKLGLSVSNYWCAPNTSKKIETLKHESSVVQATYELNMYERNIQIENISGRLTSMLVEIVHRSLPVGVYLSIHEHDDKLHEQSRYIPDHQLINFKAELKIMQAHKNDDEEEVTKKKK